MKKILILFIFSIGILFTYQTTKGKMITKTIAPTAIQKDIHSFSNPTEVITKHLSLDLFVDFDKKQISGKASLTVENKTGSTKLSLDTRDLTIEKITLGSDEIPTKFSLGEEVKYLGRALVVDILPDTKLVNIYYSTSPNAAALQWLEPSQTAGRKKPFLFTQSEPVLARTWIPCQDSPRIRITYSAKIKTRSDLLVLMSSKNNPQKLGNGTYSFEMNQPIPSYLLALAVGDIEFHSLGKRTGVYAEPSVVGKAAKEFIVLEKMVSSAEALYGPYRWGRYDVIVLPPSFPFGGMENPCLTFATPTIIAGDRSLVSLLAHELAHSWSGNLVTNATWNDFWLNEGFTVYFENRIMEAVYGKAYSEMLAQLGLKELMNTLKETGMDSPSTKLFLDLTDQDPDNAADAIAYEKGFIFLRLLEETVGRKKWDGFLKKYFDTFAFQTMTTKNFEKYLREQLITDPQLAEKIQLDQWLYGTGLPNNYPKIQSKEFTQVEVQSKVWIENKVEAKNLNTAKWTTHHWLHFLKSLPESLTLKQMEELDKAFHFTSSGNSEILTSWLVHAIQSKYEVAYPSLEKFLTSIGRRKFLKPLYGKLMETAEGLEMARQIYKKARPTYHSVSYTTIDEMFNKATK